MTATRIRTRRGRTAFLGSAIGLTLAIGALPAWAQEPAAAEPAAAEATAPAAWAFPKDLKVAGRRLTLHEPVVTEHDQERRRLTMRFAIEVTDPLGKVFPGVAEASGSVHLDLGGRLAQVDVMEVTSSAFPTLPEKALGEVQAALGDVWPQSLMLRLELITGRAGAEVAPDSPGKLSSLAPKVYVRNQPTLLLQIDGEPVIEPVGSSPLSYVINSATDLFQDPSSDAWYMLLDGNWATGKTLEGEWAWLVGKLPVVMSQIPIGHPRGHIRQFVPGTREYRSRFGKEARAKPTGSPPEIIVTKEPAELVLLEGDPLFTLVPGVKLMPVANTKSDLFFHPRLGTYFLLLSGRWFTNDELVGDWKTQFGKLPEEFQKIPRDHVRGHVVWCVSGTPEAVEAARLASLWEHAVINPSGRIEVLYRDGEISKLPVGEGGLSLITTTEDDALVAADGTHFLCTRGVWFSCATGKRDWKPVDKIPEALTQLPPGGTPYHVIFSRPTGALEGGYGVRMSAGYNGVFVVKGSVVHGTGWPRTGIKRGENWYPAQRTYGENRWYDPMTGIFQPRTVTYGDDGLPAAAAWSPYTGSYGRVLAYADRYRQGGRRMFPFKKDVGAFDTSASWTDVFGSWSNELAQREGLDRKAFPLGDRTKETAPDNVPVVADTAGTLYRRTATGGFESTAKDGVWGAAAKVPDDIEAQLDAVARFNARVAQWAAWRAERAAALPVNPSVTPMGL